MRRASPHPLFKGNGLKKLFEKSFLRIFKNLYPPKTAFSAALHFYLPENLSADIPYL